MNARMLAYRQKIQSHLRITKAMYQIILVSIAMFTIATTSLFSEIS